MLPSQGQCQASLSPSTCPPRAMGPAASRVHGWNDALRALLRPILKCFSNLCLCKRVLLNINDCNIMCQRRTMRKVGWHCTTFAVLWEKECISGMGWLSNLHLSIVPTCANESTCLGASNYRLTTGILQSSLPSLGRQSWTPSWLPQPIKMQDQILPFWPTSSLDHYLSYFLCALSNFSFRDSPFKTTLSASNLSYHLYYLYYLYNFTHLRPLGLEKVAGFHG